MTTYKTIKQFDAEVMPFNVREALAAVLDDGGTGNGTTYIKWQVHLYGQDDEDTRRLEVDAWLIEQGIKTKERVIIKCWR